MKTTQNKNGNKMGFVVFNPHYKCKQPTAKKNSELVERYQLELIARQNSFFTESMIIVPVFRQEHEHFTCTARQFK